MTEKKKINVQIDGRNFTIVGEGSKEYIESIAAYVDKIIREVSLKNDKLSQIMTATLAALHIADESRQNQKELEDLRLKAKDPLDKYDDVCEELKESKEKIVTLNSMIEEYRKQITVDDKKIEETELVVEELREKIKNQEDHMAEKEDLIKSLQDKNYESQLEIIDIKKELNEYLRLLDEKTSS